MMFDIAPMTPEDWGAVERIYLEGVATGDSTFEDAAPPWPEWDAGHLPFGRLVARAGDEVVGWVALSPVSSRCTLAGVAEVSLYVAAPARGQGVGRALLEAVIAASEAAGLWTLQSGIFPENAASLAVHRRCGFGLVGTRERFGRHHGVWRDVLLLERRSTTVGVD